MPSAFLYFVKGVRAPVTREQLVAWGLDYAFDALPYNGDANGPDGSQGVMLADVDRLAPFEPVYYEADQQWLKRPDRLAPAGAPEVWIGRYKAAPLPGPADLARLELLDGEDVPLGEPPQLWQVPKIRTLDLAGELVVALPCHLTIDDDGRPKRGGVVAKFARLIDVVKPYWDKFAKAVAEAPPDAKQIPMTIDDDVMFGVAVDVLAGNYRLGRVEAALGQVFLTGQQMGDVAWSACDCGYAWAVLNLKKKKTPSPSAS